MKSSLIPADSRGDARSRPGSTADRGPGARAGLRAGDAALRLAPHPLVHDRLDARDRLPAAGRRRGRFLRLPPPWRVRRRSLGKVGDVFWSRTVTRPSAWRCVDGKKLVADLFPAERLTQPALLRFVASARHLR